jgi:hypothetical protein
VREGIIDTAGAESIGRLYPQPQIKTSRPWALIVFSGIGAVIVGLGVILLFAYNWHEMSKFIKLTVVFGSLALALLVGISLDGPKKYHDYYRLDHSGKGTFDKVMATIEKCRKHKVEFNVLVLLNDKNVIDPDGLFDFFVS